MPYDLTKKCIFPIKLTSEPGPLVPGAEELDVADFRLHRQLLLGVGGRDALLDQFRH